MRFPVFVRSAVFVLVFAPGAGFADALLVSTLESLRDSDAAVIGESRLLSPRLLSDFYAQRGNEPVWDDSAKRQALLRVIERSPDEGLSPSDFHVDAVRKLAERGALQGLTPAAHLGADIQLSDALLRYVHHTRFGKLDPMAVDPKWNDRGPAPAGTLIADMNGALDAKDLAVFLTGRIDYPFWYVNLRRALTDLRALEPLEGLSPLPGGPNLAIGSRDPRVSLLRERLQLTGQTPAPPAGEPGLFDAGLAKVVEDFQRRVGLAPDGVVGPQTLAALNDPVDKDKIELVRINLERMRWLYDGLPQDYIFVDVADYIAQLVRDGEIAWSTRVIVGSEKDQTPMFRDTMNHVVFNPTWNVPVSIQKKMGNVSASYTLVDRRTGRKVDGGNAGDYKRYRVVQKPGPKNALGRVKFMFPNRHAVYLHDTPSRGLFGRSRRALSHGCVRVQDPVKLAELLLGASGWTTSEIEHVIDKSKTRYVNLSEELPVLLYYLTARADGRGGVDFRRDIYGRDPALRAAFAEPVSSAPIAFADPAPMPGGVESSPAAAPADDGDNKRPHQRPASPSQEPGSSQAGVRLTQADTPEH